MTTKPATDQDLKLAIALSVEDVAGRQRDGGRSGLEVQNPERAAQVLLALCEGESCRSIQKRYGCKSKVLTRLCRDHAVVLSRSRRARVTVATELAMKAGKALGLKLDSVISDESLLAKTPARDLSVAYGVTVDKVARLEGEKPTVVHEHKVSLQDAQDAIDAARRRLAERALLDCQQRGRSKRVN